MTQTKQGLERWREEHPGLARDCKQAAIVLLESQYSFIQEMATAVIEGQVGGGGFTLMDFIDTYGARFQQLALISQALNQLGG